MSNLDWKQELRRKGLSFDERAAVLSRAFDDLFGFSSRADDDAAIDAAMAAYQAMRVHRRQPRSDDDSEGRS